MKKNHLIITIIILIVVVVLALMLNSNILNGGKEGTTSNNTTNKIEEVTPTGTVIKPFDNSMDLVNFQDETFNTSFKTSDIKDTDGELKIEMEVYQNSTFDAVEIANLKIGDIIMFLNKEVLVENIDNNDGVIKINGGTSSGGYCLESIGGGVYSLVKDDKTPVYTSVGVMSLKVDQDFELIDNKYDKKTYLAGDLFELMKTIRKFDVDSTTGRVENGILVEVICN